MIDISDDIRTALRARFTALRREADTRFPGVDRSIQTEAIQRLCEELLGSAVGAYRQRWPEADDSDVAAARTQVDDLLKAWLREDGS